jgi:hypothetical protein
MAFSTVQIAGGGEAEAAAAAQRVLAIPKAAKAAGGAEET